MNRHLDERKGTSLEPDDYECCMHSFRCQLIMGLLRRMLRYRRIHSRNMCLLEVYKLKLRHTHVCAILNNDLPPNRNRFCNLLVYSTCSLLEVKDDLLVGKLAVYSSVCFNPSLHVRLISRVKGNLHNSLSIGLHSGSFSDDLSGVHDIVKDGVLDCRQCSRTRSGSTRLLVTTVSLS
jgi:hypothetical protein